MRIRPLLVAALVCAVTAPLARADDPAPHVKMRGGLANSFRKFAASQQTQAHTKVSYFGGSITAGAGASRQEKSWRGMLHKHLRDEHPGANLAEQNAALGGTGSWLGAFRTRNQAMYGGAALVIVEFAVNDGGQPEQQVIASMEGIVRQIWKIDPTADLLFVYTMVKQHLDDYNAGRLPPTVQWHERVAEHYGIPSVHMAAYAAQRISAGELTFDAFAKDGVHPTDRGYALYFDALKPLVVAAKAANAASGDAVPMKRHALPPPLSPAPMEKAQCVPYEWCGRTGDWKVGQKSSSDAFLHVVESDKPGATLTLKFKGAQCGYFNLIGPDTGDLEVSVDGGPWQHKADWDPYCKNSTRAHARALATGLDPTQWHEVRLRIAEKQPAESKGRFQRIGYLLADGEVADPMKGVDPLQRLDVVWDGIRRPLKIDLPADRWQHVPQTMRRLRDGPTVRMVLLGDSIMGDTASSNFELLLDRLYPKCKVDKVLSNRGSTGCWWYKDENRVESYVLRHNPDLLMIGGISQRDDTESIRAVIRQVREKQPTCEFLLITPAFGSETDKHIKEWRYDIDPASDSYRARLQKLAAEERCAFLDMTGPWWQFVQESGSDYGYFRRDKVHANERGYQILGRILERFFAPAKP